MVHRDDPIVDRLIVRYWRQQKTILNELQTSNCCLGYRAMWRLLQLKYRYTIKRSTVMMLLAVMDPIASRLRDYWSMHRSS
ncbi:hypothetical protein EMCRGX_G013579 [Ephydatia muelleri]